uniref:Tetratricopeptide repeat protein n=1 Tax=Desulfomonile tiedjei TaxID=2358 RepID=A0A7C4EWR5_9BACT
MMKNTRIAISWVVVFGLGFLAGVFFAAWKLESAGPSSVSQAPVSGDQVSAQDIQKRIAGIERMLKENPHNMEALIQLGNDYFDTAQYEKAVEAYQKALVMDPRNPDVLTDLGVSYRKLKKPQEAVQAFRQALEADPGHVITLFNLGIVLRDDMKDYAGAIQAWEEFLNKAGDSPHAMMVKPWLKALKEKTGQKEGAEEKEQPQQRKPD